MSGSDLYATTDILIIGASMTGSCLARQLKLRYPDLNIVNIDSRTKFSYWIGESTVEAWEDYMVRHLKLGPFLEKNFISKHGLRMFFDNEEKSLSLKDMSEFGRSSYHSIAARNIDRVKFDTYMYEKNLELGVDVRLGVKVLSGEGNIILDKDKGHIVSTDKGKIKCKWLIDAGGRTAPLAKTLKLVDREERNPSFSVWSRIKGAKWIDDLGDDEWRKRVNYTIRNNSTNHFMYKGYWMWLIPLSDDVVSIGVEGRVDKVNLKIRNQTQFEEFLRSHKCVDELLGDDSEFLDFNSYSKLPRCSKQFFSTDRWFLTGMSGLFIDVMGSGTSRIYSENNRMIEDMIDADLNGDLDRLRSQEKHYNIYMKTLFELHFRNLNDYDLYGSFDLWPNFFGAGLSGYFNKHLPNCITDLAAIKKTIEDHRDGCECSIEKSIHVNLEEALSSKLYKLVNEFKDFLEDNGAYFANNKGQYHDPEFWENRESIRSKMYSPRDIDVEMNVDKETYRHFCENVVKRMCEVKGEQFSMDVFEKSFVPEWTSDQSLGDLLASQLSQGSRNHDEKDHSSKKVA